MILLYNSNLKSQTLVRDDQIQFHTNSLVKLTKQKINHSENMQQPQLREWKINSIYPERLYQNIKPEVSDDRSPHYKHCLKIECLPKLLMRCQRRARAKSVQVQVKLRMTVLTHTPPPTSAHTPFPDGHGNPYAPPRPLSVLAVHCFIVLLL